MVPVFYPLQTGNTRLKYLPTRGCHSTRSVQTCQGGIILSLRAEGTVQVFVKVKLTNQGIQIMSQSK